jgi:hypothetical protein
VNGLLQKIDFAKKGEEIRGIQGSKIGDSERMLSPCLWRHFNNRRERMNGRNRSASGGKKNPGRCGRV